ncbi:ribulokinase [Propionicicella superfundia]|uniref:ribulokinase n=1 Tax=Propionicicella superfundia TaxID=348582 RepID=UPI0004177E07|nr:ribulokinase [Propionicicella superfundia]
MSDEKYVCGIDFGTLSGRAIIVRVSDGEEMGSAVHEYKNAVMDRVLTAHADEPLPPDFALQYPEDYIEVLKIAVPEAIRRSGVKPEDIIGVGTDFTSATMIATDENGWPLCQRQEFADHIHAYVKLWKHHGGQAEADQIIALAKKRGEKWLKRYGDTLSSEFMLPKLLETFHKDRAVYDAMKCYVDGVDWIVWQLTGNYVRSAGATGYKALYQDGTFPSQDFFAELDPEFANAFDKLDAPVGQLGDKAGEITAEAAAWTGLKAGTPVAVGNIDAHVTAPACQAVEDGQMTAILGTSSVFVVSGPELREVPGMFGVVDGGLVKGSWGFEGGQSAVGDIFAWFTQNCVPPSYHDEAAGRGISIHELLTEKAADQEIGQHGLVAIDWHNGNRSVLVDANLSGAIVGQTLTTSPEDQYRALMEATAFGFRVIIEAFAENDVEITEVVAAGGLLKNSFLMQMYSDVTRKPLSLAVSAYAGALGSAIHGAVAAGAYPDVPAAAKAMGKKIPNAYTPSEEAAVEYDKLYAEYKTLHDYFGRGGNDVMYRLKDIKREAAARKHG